MANRSREAFERFLRNVMIPHLRDAGVDQVSTATDDELVAGSLGHIGRSTRTYELPTIRVMAFLAGLIRPEATEDEWRLGRLLWNQLIRDPEANPLGGRPPKSADRLFTFFYIETAVQVHETSRAEAIRRACVLFDLAPATVKAWYRKGMHTEERTFIRQLMETLSLDPEDLEREIRHYLPPDAEN